MREEQEISGLAGQCPLRETTAWGQRDLLLSYTSCDFCSSNFLEDQCQR